jgi:alpha-D-ribose 1-methylphosphonate 5-triphosphate synthase subunit PhnH
MATGFSDPVHDAQQAFRWVLDAMARPAHWSQRPVCTPHLPGLSPAATALALTLVDSDTALHLGRSATDAEADLRRRCGARASDDPSAADFAFVSAAEFPGLDAFATGTDLAPEASTTLILEVDGADEATGLVATGPGLDEPAPLVAVGLPPDFATSWCEQFAHLPRGVDVLLTAGDALCALPRSIRLEPAPCMQP